MKKRLLCMTLLLAAVLSGCGQKNAPETQMGAAASPETTAPADSAGDRNPTAVELGRDETTDLIFLAEGTEETVPATLYIGQGYSIYIPDEGWRPEKDMENGIPADTWESTVNDDVELRVLHLGEKTLEEAQAWVIAEEDDFQLTEDKQGGLAGMDAEDRDILEVRFCPAGTGMYGILYQYPTEAAEGFGARLSVIADTFEVME